MKNEHLATMAKNAGMASAQRGADLFFCWSDAAYECLCEFLRRPSQVGKEFMCEDFRDYLENFKRMPSPPDGSKTAYGAVIQRAQIAGLIKFVRYDKTSSVKSHRAVANVWVGV